MNDVVLESGVDVPEELYGTPVVLTFEEILCNPQLEFLKAVAYERALNKDSTPFVFDIEKAQELFLSLFELTPLNNGEFSLQYREMNFDDVEVVETSTINTPPQQLELDLETIPDDK